MDVIPGFILPRGVKRLTRPGLNRKIRNSFNPFNCGPAPMALFL
jgi:hypothetical protein